MYYILCKDQLNNIIGRSDRVFFPFQIDSILKELNAKEDGYIYYKQLDNE
ncbi:hypothetical protein [Caudoviricetes sp.]|nr:MAG: hypothetical protein [Podoviridae sp. ct2cs2]UOF77549.1 hypothetical protein [Caudoviricetes sp.]